MSFAQQFGDDAATNGTTCGHEGRQFLEQRLKALVTAAMKEVLVQQPPDPLAFIARYLKKHNPSRVEREDAPPCVNVTTASGSEVKLHRVCEKPGQTKVQKSSGEFAIYGLHNPSAEDIKSLAAELKGQGQRVMRCHENARILRF